MLITDLCRIDAPKKGSCPKRGIRYPPKSGSEVGGTSVCFLIPSPGAVITLPRPQGSGTVVADSHLGIVNSYIDALRTAGRLSVQAAATYAVRHVVRRR